MIKMTGLQKVIATIIAFMWCVGISFGVVWFVGNKFDFDVNYYIGAAFGIFVGLLSILIVDNQKLNNDLK